MQESLGEGEPLRNNSKVYSKISKKHPFNTKETVMEELRTKKDVRHIEKKEQNRSPFKSIITLNIDELSFSVKR